AVLRWAAERIGLARDDAEAAELLLERLPARHQGGDLAGEALLLRLEALHLGGRGAVEEAGVAEALVDGVHARLELLELRRHLVALGRELLLLLLRLAIVLARRGGRRRRRRCGRLLLLSLALLPQERSAGVEVVVAQALEVLLVGAAEVADALRRDLEDAVGEPLHEPAVVRHEE